VILKEDEDFMDDEFNTAASSFQDDNSAEQDLAALLKMVRWYCHFVVEDAKHPLLGFADEISQRHGGI
jgi:hypothetical protein